MKKFPSENQVNKLAAEEFEANIDSLISAVDKRMTIRLEEKHLIGSNTLSVMYDNHENHANLMANVFFFSDYDLLENILPWVISSYTSRGFSLEYFPEVLDQWKKAIAQHLSKETSDQIIPVYEWMESMLPGITEAEASGTLEVRDPNEVFKQSFTGEVKHFVNLLLRGNHNEAHQFIRQRIEENGGLREAYNKVIQPAMYEIGRQWESNKITVAHEHLATSIIMRLITYFYMDYVSTEKNKGNVVVTAAANEYHEVGARIVADFMEMDGWDVSYLGANIPSEELIRMLEETPPDILCISVTMAFNFTKVRDLIDTIRNNPALSSLKIMVGGYAFNYSRTIPDKLGADAAALTASECLRIAQNWWNEAVHA